MAQDQPPIREYNIETIAKLGQEIYQQDIIAARATDIVFKQQLDLSRFPIRGWIVTEDKRGPLVTFVGDYEGDYRAVFEVRPESHGKSRFRKVEGLALSKEKLSRFRARVTAEAQITSVCSNRYNSIVLKDPVSDSWLVYFLAATMESDSVLIGGHYRFTISADGQNVQNIDMLFRSCATQSKNPPDMPEGGQLHCT